MLSAFWKLAWHGLGRNELHLSGRPPGRFRTRFVPADPSWHAAEAVGVIDPGGGEVVPAEPASREELLAYVEHNRQFLDRCLDRAQEVGDGQSTLGAFRGPTSVLLFMFHANACHLVSHGTELAVFLNQRR